MEAMLTIKVVLLVGHIIKLLVKAVVGNNVADKLARVSKLAFIIYCFPSSRGFITWRIIMKIVMFSERVPGDITIRC